MSYAMAEALPTGDVIDNTLKDQVYYEDGVIAKPEKRGPITKMKQWYYKHIIQSGLSAKWEQGIDFNYKTTLFTNSFDAHRLVKFTLTKNSSVVEKLHELLFKAYFVDNKKLADKNVLLDIAGQVGMDLDEVNEMLDGDEYKDEVLLDEKTAYQLGIHAVPYFIFENKYVVPGALSTDDFKNVLSKVLTEEETETSDAKQCSM